MRPSKTCARSFVCFSLSLSRARAHHKAQRGGAKRSAANAFAAAAAAAASPIGAHWLHNAPKRPLSLSLSLSLARAAPLL